MGEANQRTEENALETNQTIIAPFDSEKDEKKTISAQTIRTWAILLFPIPNSEVVAISLTIVLDKTFILSLEDKTLVAFFFAFFAFSKKYFTFFL